MVKGHHKFWGTIKVLGNSVIIHVKLVVLHQEHMTEGASKTQRGFGIHRSCVFLNAALPYKEDCLQKLHNKLLSACEYDY